LYSLPLQFGSKGWLEQFPEHSYWDFIAVLLYIVPCVEPVISNEDFAKFFNNKFSVDQGVVVFSYAIVCTFVDSVITF